MYFETNLEEWSCISILCIQLKIHNFKITYEIMSRYRVFTREEIYAILFADTDESDLEIEKDCCWR